VFADQVDPAGRSRDDLRLAPQSRAHQRPRAQGKLGRFTRRHEVHVRSLSANLVTSDVLGDDAPPGRRFPRVLPSLKLPSGFRPVIVAATRAEAAYVPGGLDLVITGLGKTAAATAVARSLATLGSLDDVVVINIGTAGALRDGVTGLHEPGTVFNHDINADAIRALGYDPEERIELDAGEIVLATGDVFVTDPAVRDRLALQAHLVDMEGYAVAYAARHFGVGVRMAKHVSDNADEGAVDWPAVVDASARELGLWLESLLG
jgi:adenosylhomocysteine nucleosidase